MPGLAQRCGRASTQGHVRHAHPALGRRSRLGCQVIAAKELDGIRVRIPGATRNFAVDGHVPKPH